MGRNIPAWRPRRPAFSDCSNGLSSKRGFGGDRRSCCAPYGDGLAQVLHLLPSTALIITHRPTGFKPSRGAGGKPCGKTDRPRFYAASYRGAEGERRRLLLRKSPTSPASRGAGAGLDQGGFPPQVPAACLLSYKAQGADRSLCPLFPAENALRPGGRSSATRRGPAAFPIWRQCFRPDGGATGRRRSQEAAGPCLAPFQKWLSTAPPQQKRRGEQPPRL